MSAKEQTAIEIARERADKAQGGPSIDSIVTCPSSRHVLAMADFLSDDGKYQMFEDDPEHCALSLYSAVTQLWEKKTELTALQADMRRLVEALQADIKAEDAERAFNIYRAEISAPEASEYHEPYDQEQYERLEAAAEWAKRGARELRDAALESIEANNPSLKPE